MENLNAAAERGAISKREMHSSLKQIIPLAHMRARIYIHIRMRLCCVCIIYPSAAAQYFGSWMALGHMPFSATQHNAPAAAERKKARRATLFLLFVYRDEKKCSLKCV
jgi:hypothetical protein